MLQTGRTGRGLIAIATATLLLLAACSSQTRRSDTTPRVAECVVLLHGLRRNADSMQPLEEALQKAGYLTANVDYDSRARTIEQLADEAVPEGIRLCREQGARRIHFVTHSMGGILVRWWLAHNRPAELGRVVMLAPPNHGSEIVDRLARYSAFRWATGPAGPQLRTGAEGLPEQIGPADYPLGIITGDRQAPWDLLFRKWLPGRDDGKVSVDSARLEGMHDLLVVHASHTFIMLKDEVIAQVIAFLREGRFHHPTPRHHDTTTPRHHDTTTPRHHDTTTPRHHDSRTIAATGPKLRPRQNERIPLRVSADGGQGGWHSASRRRASAGAWPPTSLLK